ncbi:MAG TPA: HAD family hydrolase [Phycisphaerae bacterium]|nr:HAD family hydrolase [Phycisphaerae bacterium]
MNFDGVIFDMDGTLIESHLDFTAIRAKLGIPMGLGIIESIDEMAPDQAESARQHLREVELASVRLGRVMPGCHELLKAIKLASLPAALLTRNSAEAMAIALDKIGADYFDITWSREQGPIKPEPDGVLKACKQMGIVPEKTLCVGDFHYDIIAANSAGAVSVLLSTDGVAEFADDADYVIASLNELMEILALP